MIAQSTVSLVEGFLRPLGASGVVHPTEVKAVVSLMREATANPDKPEAESKKLLTRQQAADRLSVSTKTISRMISASELDAHYLRKGSPRTLRITARSVERFETINGGGES